ncbi:Present in the outer mitochondrial membrane proteome 5 [Trypanosoma cruzi]|uniref:Present in the outer mitochondrial membrane proteome 5 n=2 Tax=Trypanosoma cruzi TaxID=5693 RepID=Q4CSP9_TRYCC|nr:hypothetical protein, conserved [Trypanosoma cruzi]EAN83302.1 hypothetical protein, conserved [Trypanosoma cruzi]KAF5224108.1 Present in the outer mitochondrial membrane proteome 5 [Trypanosoma cruzi]KAF8298839.1 Present in the outer mitochondrial membrane proteome 5 [Trypanosoma cruzi]RNC61773.1 hypothetical protein TcCL_ESM00384 [Trypanosoma cruzi]|eukprot:XP_805153.1 hypothetical protein [Trypanosoma cruzi strain CL Brener]
MSLLNTTLQTLVVRLRDMSGNVTQQKLHNRVFDAYEAKSLVFEAISPEQQAVMQQFGTIPSQHPAGQPVLLDGWADLLTVHREDNLYQLLPRRAKNNASYSTMRAICCSAGSPFTMDHRVDPIDYKFVFRAADMEVRNKFNATNQDKIPPTIWFDGILSAPNDSGLVSCHNSLSPAHINNLAGTYQFLKEWSNEPPEGDRHRQLKEMYSNLLSKRTHLFIGSSSVPGREILNYARSKNVFVYAKRGMHYVFHA